MAKETFYNLPEEKRKRIEAAAITELANAGYDKATIDHVAQQAGISKGIFYQYFKNKKDLMFYIIFEVLMQKKLAYLSPALKNNENLDFFTHLRELFVAGLQFAVENPELDQIGTWFMRNTSHPIFVELLSRVPDMAANTYGALIQKGIEQGQLRTDIDVSYTSNLITTLLSTTIEHYFKQNPIATYRDSKDEILAAFNQMLKILKDGIAK